MECTSCHSALIDDAAYCPRCGARQPGVPECDTYDYAAFVSYRHREPDASVAARLHRALEAYRLPKAVAASYGSPKLGRVFRDSDELPATGSLPSSIRQALRHSRSLVVVCSSSTPGSRWVEQEIETFASYHGPDRVFAVLAEGASAESMPRSLRTRLVPPEEPGGEPRTVDAEPLAADMRATSKSPFSLEKLRVIAGIAGCGYDDLRRRDRARRRRLAAIAAVAAILLAAVVGALAFQAHDQRQAALVEESQRLAAQSQQLLAHGDRYQAIETALAALPASSHDTSRPLVLEAQEALEQALEIYPGASPWRSSYSLETESSMQAMNETSVMVNVDTELTSASSIAVCNDPGYFAISDDAGHVNTYDLFTGAHLATCTMPGADEPIQDGLYVHVLQCAGKHLIVSNPSNATVACFDALTGEVIWSYDDVAISTMAASMDGTLLDAASLSPEGLCSAGAIYVETGEIFVATQAADKGFSTLGNGVKSAMGPRAADYCLAVGNKLVRFDLNYEDISNVPAATLAHPQLSSLAWYDDTIIACTVETYDDEELELGFAVEAFDADLHKKWDFKGKVTSEMVDNGTYRALMLGWPTLKGCVFRDNMAAVVTVGRNIYAFDLATGEVAYEHGFASTVLDALPWEADPDAFQLFIACVDGTIVDENPESPTRNYDGDQFRLQLGEPIRWSAIAPSGGIFHWLSASTEADNRLVAYRTDLTNGTEPDHEYTLDELIEEANELLEEAHYGN